MTIRAAAPAIAAGAAGLLYLVQSAAGTLLAPRDLAGAVPGWTSPWWIAGVVAFAVALAVLLPGSRRRGAGRVALTVAVVVLAWLVVPAGSVAVQASTPADALNVTSLVLLFAFTLHLSGWAALLIAGIAAWGVRAVTRS